MKRTNLLSVIDHVHDGTRYRIKDLEKAQVFHHVCDRGTASRKEIVQGLRMRPTTVSTMVNELLAQRILLDGGAVPQVGKGRPEIRLVPNQDRFSVLAVYGRSQHIHVAAVNLGGSVMQEQDLRFSSNATNGVILRGVSKAIKALFDAVWSDTEVIGVGMSLYGLVDGTRNRWLLSSRWPRLKNADLEPLLPKPGLRLMTQRTLDSELNYMLLRNPEYRHGSTLLVHWGYGIGASYSRSGRILTSGLGTFGELGHVPLAVEEALTCQCGGRGCLETVAALWKLMPDIKAKFAGISEEETELGTFFSATPYSEVPGVDRAVEIMAKALASIYTILYPDRMVVYGPFVQNRQLVKDLSERTREALQPYSRSRFRLEVRSIGPDTAAIGCTAPLLFARLREELRAN